MGLATRIAVAFACLGALLAFSAAGASAAVVGPRVLAPGQCNNTWLGTPLDDGIAGSGFGDLILGGAGDDTISSAGGNDCLQGELGDDVVRGGAGDDDVRGGP